MIVRGTLDWALLLSIALCLGVLCWRRDKQHGEIFLGGTIGCVVGALLIFVLLPWLFDKRDFLYALAPAWLRGPFVRFFRLFGTAVCFLFLVLSIFTGAVLGWIHRARR